MINTDLGPLTANKKLKKTYTLIPGSSSSYFMNENPFPPEDFVEDAERGATRLKK